LSECSRRAVGVGRGIYVERLIRADVERVWALTQTPEQHERWDARFGVIEYLPRGEGEPQRFRYARRVLPRVAVSGTGVSAGEARRPDGTRTSVLRFASTHWLSPVVSGSGYWRYVPTEAGVRFLTGYDYVPRYGRPFDAVFRPLMGWATAWSFDRLRLWAERGVTPEASLRRAGVDVAVRGAVVVAAVVRVTGPAGLPAGWMAVVGLGVLLALFAPPLPGTPAARRCLRRAPDRISGTPPRILATLRVHRQPGPHR
jgi:hypothetical protein